MRIFVMMPEFRAVYEDSEFYGWVEQPELKWQAQWYSGTTYHADGYERGGFYETEAEALEGAKRGKANMRWMQSLFEDNQP
jgi:hypothetical protein